LASRITPPMLLGCLLLCGAAWLCARPSGVAAVETQPVQVAPAPSFPIAMDARVAGDGRQTRFILDLSAPVSFHAFAIADPYRLVLDMPQVSFRLRPGLGGEGRGLIKAFRYGLVMPGGSRIVFDLTGPAKIASAHVLEAANGQPPRLVLDLEEVDRTTFLQLMAAESKTEAGAGAGEARPTAPPAVANVETTPKTEAPADPRPVIVIDPGHGGPDNGTQSGNETEKSLVLEFAVALRDHIEKTGKYRVVMTRTDDTFIPLSDRVRVARNQSAALLVSIHADALPRREGDAQGATIYTLSDRASDAEAERLAEAENKADAIGGVNLTEEPTEVADILIDLAQRETRTFSNRFARILMGEMKTATRMHKHPLKSAGFKVLKAPDVPSVLIELGYVSNKDDLEHLVSEHWRSRTAGSVARAIDTFFAKRLATAGAGN
jgi:N-acetylmuramoyl-L-alanine amidase